MGRLRRLLAELPTQNTIPCNITILYNISHNTIQNLKHSAFYSKHTDKYKPTVMTIHADQTIPNHIYALA